MTRHRKLVLFFSEIPPELEAILVAAGFLPRRITEAKLGQYAPEALALVLLFEQLLSFRAEFRRTNDLAWRHGLLLLIVDETKDPGSAVQVWEHIKLKDREAHPGTPIAVEFPNWPRVAMQIAAFAGKVGPGQNPNLIVEPTSIPPDHQFLLRRSFGKFTKIRVQNLDGGASGASVYRVTAFEAAGAEHPIPFLAKIGATIDLEFEHVHFRNEVRDFIPFNLRPSIISPLSCYGPETGILVEDFVERAIPFREALRVGDPSLLVTSLFQGTLRGWRRTSTKQLFSTKEVFRTPRGTKKEIVRNNERFTDACKTASSHFAKKYDPTDVIARFDPLQVENAEFCTIHGDLHSRNVFVAAGSASCLIIDYANVSDGPACLDPACLEVDLLLDTVRPEPRRHFLKRAYAWPLKPLSAEDRLHCDPWVWEAIRALRIEAGVTSDPRPYVLSLIGYFLRFARLTTPLRKRATAVCIAEWLIRKLLDDQEQKTKADQAISKNSRRDKRRSRKKTTRAKR